MARPTCQTQPKTLPGRLELPTLRLTASRSNQLSYGSTHTHTHTHTCDQTHTSPRTNHLTPYPTQQPKNNNHNNSCGIATLFVCYVGRSTWHGRLAAQFCLWSCVTAVCSHLSCVGVRVGCNYAKPSRHATVLRVCVGCPRAPFAFMRCCGSCACVHWVCHLGRVMLLCAPNGGLTDGVSWSGVRPARHVDGLPLPNT